MKAIRQICATFVLTFVFATFAFAGQMQTPVAEPPPPPPSSVMADGQMSTPVAGQMETTNNAASPVDPVTQLALSLLQSMLSLF